MIALNICVALFLFVLKMFKEEFSIDKFELVCQAISKQFDIEPTLESILFLIGIQELGQGFKEFDRDEKMNLINLGTLRVLSEFAYYVKASEPDRDNWPIYQINQSIKLPKGEEQEEIIKQGIIQYFENNNLLN